MIDVIITIAIVLGIGLFAWDLRARRSRPRHTWGELDSAHVARAFTRRPAPPRTVHVGRWLQ